MASGPEIKVCAALLSGIPPCHTANTPNNQIVSASDGQSDRRSQGTVFHLFPRRAAQPANLKILATKEQCVFKATN